MPLGPLGVLKAGSTYTFQGKARAEGKDAVELRSVISKSAFTPGNAEVQGFRVIKGDIKLDRDPKRTHGTVYFSPALGRTVKSVKKSHLTGSLTTSAMGNMITMDLEQEETVTARILDKNPLR